MSDPQTTTETADLPLEERRTLYREHLNRERAKINGKIMALRRELNTLDNCERQYEEWYATQIPAGVCSVEVKPDVYEMLTGESL